MYAQYKVMEMMLLFLLLCFFVCFFEREGGLFDASGAAEAIYDIICTIQRYRNEIYQ